MTSPAQRKKNLEHLARSAPKLTASIREAIVKARAIELARLMQASDDLEIDDDPKTSRAPSGTWVQAWVYVPDED